jgi:ribosomal protein S18 acetylase RimI-like enzyme
MESAPHVIRIATIDDLDQLRKLEAETFGETGLPLAQLRWLLEGQGENPSFHLRVAFESDGAKGDPEDTLLGFVCWKERRDENGLALEILDLSVGSSYRDERVEHALVDRVLEEARKDRALGVSVNVPQSNMAGAQFYLQQGFTLAHTVASYYADGSGMDVFLKRLR